MTGAAEALLWLIPARMTVPQFDRLSAFIPDKERKVLREDLWWCVALARYTGQRFEGSRASKAIPAHAQGKNSQT